jgi:dihydrofolate reductase
VRSVTYSMSMSLDGYIVGPDGSFDWGLPDEVFRFWIDEIRQVGVHLLGRRLYETMLYWETADQDRSLDDAELEWAALWNPLPKVVFSTLSAVQGTARLASGSLAAEIERLRAEPGEGEIAIGGATLAAEAAGLGLIDEYRAVVYPVLVGGGIPFFPRRERRVDLELVETRTFSSRESSTCATALFASRLVRRAQRLRMGRNVLAPSITVRSGRPAMAVPVPVASQLRPP